MAKFAFVMNIEHYYKVAEHNFCLNLPESEKLWNSLDGQYGPFEITKEKAVAEGLLFTIDYTREPISTEGANCIYDVPTEDGETVVKLYDAGDKGWIFETAQDHRMPICARIAASRDFSKAEIHLETRLLRDAVFGINNAAMLVYAFASATHHTLEFHSSVIENNGKAYLFLGKSGTGKSTHSSLWLKYIEGSVLMNDDNPVVRIWPDGKVIAYGSPWSGKTPCYKNVSAPVGALVQIRQWPENIITKMSILESYSSVFSSISGIKDDNSSMADDLNDSLSDLLSAAPCFRMDCRPDEEAARVCSSKLLNL